MRALCLLLLAASALADAPRPAAVAVGKCTGADPCLVCTDCTRCGFCSPKNPRGGSCGVVRAQDAAAAAARMKKQEGK